MNEALFKTILNRSMNLASRREMCAKDVRDKTRQWGASEEESDKIVDILYREKFIDELRYARAFVNDKSRYNKWGRIKIATALKMKGINQEVVKIAIDDIDEDFYKKTLEDLLKAHGKSIKARNDYEYRAKLIRFGLSRGFESWLINEITGDQF